jgi:hypothetical protein
MNGELRLQLAEDGADAERLDTLTGFLRQELLDLDVDEVTAAPAAPPPGARAFDAAVAGSLLVSLSQSGESLLSVITSIRGWLARSGVPQRAVRLELGGDVIELSHASAADQDQLVELFLRRHGDEGQS